MRQVSRIRATHPEFRRETFLKGSARRAFSKDVSWLSAAGAEMTPRDWQDPEVRSLGIKFAVNRPGVAKVLLLVNAGFDAIDFPLPASAVQGWRRVFDTAVVATAADNCEPLACFMGAYRIESHSMVLLEA